MVQADMSLIEEVIQNEEYIDFNAMLYDTKPSNSKEKTGTRK